MSEDELKACEAWIAGSINGKVIAALVAEVRRLRDARDLAAVEAGVYLGAFLTTLNEGWVDIERLESKLNPDAYAILRASLDEMSKR